MRNVQHPSDDSRPVLVVDDHLPARESIADALDQSGYHTHCCASGSQAVQWLKANDAEVMITDLQMPGMNGLELIQRARHLKPDLQVVMITAHGTISTAVEAMRLGAFDFIEKPFELPALERVIHRALTEDNVVQQPADSDQPDDFNMVGQSAAMQVLRQRIQLVAATQETVLITGESGTGKELVARSIHCQSDRRPQALVGLNCPALSPQLMESELFGHEQGAFTGADAQRVGRFELAGSGTILLDEVTEIELTLQAKLLRVLQERTFERVGSSLPQKLEARVLATTNRKLDEEVESGRFRQDLYYRLAVVPVEVPPLRKRIEDIPWLAAHFLTLAAERLQRDALQTDSSAEDLMCNYHWPGNVRELENVMTRATVLCQQGQITADTIAPWLLKQDASPQQTLQAGMRLEDMERQLIEATLQRFAGHRTRAAEALGIGVRTLTNKLRNYGYPPRAQFQDRASA